MSKERSVKNHCNAQYRDHTAVCTLEAGHPGDHHAKAVMETAAGNEWIVELWWWGYLNEASQEHLGAK